MKQRRTGQVIRKGERKHLVRIFLGRDESGKRHFHNHTVHGTKKDAETYVREALRRRDLDLPLEVSRETLGKVLDKWLEGPLKQRLRLHSLWEYRETVERYIRPKLGSKLISCLTPGELQDFASYLTNNRNLGAVMVNHVFMILSGALTQAVKWRLIRENPVRLVEKPKMVRKEMHAMSAEEATRFLDAAMLDPYHHLFDLMLQTGCRPSEALALKWSDIDLKASTVTIQRGIHWARDTKIWHISPPKTPKGARTLPLNEPGVKLLEECKRSQNVARLKARNWQNHGFIFTDESGAPLDPHSVRYHFKHVLKAAGLSKDFRLYDLRHTCATMLAAAGVNPKTVSERLGHANSQTTLDIYTHVSPGMQQEATNILENLLYRSTGTS